MSENFDPYHKWLGIPREDQPPHHYRLLGIELFEDDPDVIDAAADRQMTHVQTYKTGKHSKLSQRLLNELAAARVSLLRPELRTSYDANLRSQLAQQAGPSTSPTRAPEPTNNPVLVPPVASSGDVHKPSRLAPIPIRSSPAQGTTTSAQHSIHRRWNARRDSATHLWRKYGVLCGLPLATILISLALYLRSSESDSARLPDPQSRTPSTLNLQTKHVAIDSRPQQEVSDGKRSQPAESDTPDAHNSVEPNSQAPHSQAPRPTGRSTPAVVEVARMKPHPFPAPVDKWPVDFPSHPLEFGFEVQPKAVNVDFGRLEVVVKESGMVYLAAKWEYQGNRGAWTSERLTKEQLVRQGWTDLGPCPWDARYTLFRRECKAGEELKIRVNKYWPPLLIVGKREEASR